MRADTFRTLRRRLRSHDRRFETSTRGKGSHRTIHHPDVNGRPASFTVPCHDEGSEVKRPYLVGIRRRFALPDDFFD